jgi:MATE family multidrug resistance protein
MPIIFFKEIKLALTVSTPIILYRLIGFSGGLIYMLLMAQLGKNALASGALISSIYNTIIMLLWGCLFPVTALIAKAYGSGEVENIGIVFKQGLILATVICFPIFVIICFFEPLLIFFKQPIFLSHSIHAYFHVIAYGILPNMWLCVINLFLNAIFRAMLVTISTLLNVISTTLLGYALLFGKWGLPNLGILGIAYSISIIYWLQLFCLIVYLVFNKSVAQFNIFKGIKKIDFKVFKMLFKMGWPISLQYGAELGAFAILTFILGTFGAHVLAAQQIALQCNTFAIIIPLALSQSAAILVSKAWGAGDLELAKRYSFILICVGLCFSSGIALFYTLAPLEIIRLYLNINEPNNIEIIHLAIIFLIFSAITQLFDSIRNISTGGLRGFHDVKMPMYVGIFSFWVIGLPISWLLLRIFPNPIILRTGFVLGISIGAVYLLKRLWTLEPK